MTRNRTLVISALLASLGPMVGNGIWAGPDGDGEEILATARDGLPTSAYIGIILEVIGFGALLVLFAWLVVRTFREAPIAAVTTAVAGSAMVAVKLGSAAPLMVVHSIPEKLNARTAETMVSLNDQAFVISGFLLCVAFLASGVGLLQTTFPRWLALWATIAGGLGVLAGAAGIVNPDTYVPLPFLFCLLWMIVTAIATVMRSEDGGSIPSNADPVSVAATE